MWQLVPEVDLFELDRTHGLHKEHLSLLFRLCQLCERGPEFSSSKDLRRMMDESQKDKFLTEKSESFHRTVNLDPDSLRTFDESKDLEIPLRIVVVRLMEELTRSEQKLHNAQRRMPDSHPFDCDGNSPLFDPFNPSGSSSSSSSSSSDSSSSVKNNTNHDKMMPNVMINEEEKETKELESSKSTSTTASSMIIDDDRSKMTKPVLSHPMISSIDQSRRLKCDYCYQMSMHIRMLQEIRAAFRLFVTRLAELSPHRCDYLAGMVDACSQTGEYHSVIRICVFALVKCYDCCLFDDSRPFSAAVDSMRDSLGLDPIDWPSDLRCTFISDTLLTVDSELPSDVVSSSSASALTSSAKTASASAAASAVAAADGVDSGDSKREPMIVSYDVMSDDSDSIFSSSSSDPVFDMHRELAQRETHSFTDLFAGLCQSLFALEEWQLLFELSEVWLSTRMSFRLPGNPASHIQSGMTPHSSDALWWKCQVYSRDYHVFKDLHRNDQSDDGKKTTLKEAYASTSTDIIVSSTRTMKAEYPLLRHLCETIEESKLDETEYLSQEFSKEQRLLYQRWYANEIVSLMTQVIQSPPHPGSSSSSEKTTTTIKCDEDWNGSNNDDLSDEHANIIDSSTVDHRKKEKQKFKKQKNHHISAKKKKSRRRESMKKKKTTKKMSGELGGMPWHYVRRAYFLWELGKREEAINDLSVVLSKIDPNYQSALNDRAFYLNECGRYTEALNDCNLGLKIDSSRPNLYRHRGYAQFYLGNLNEAIQDTNLALALKPGYHEAIRNLQIIANFYSDALNDTLNGHSVIHVPVELIHLVCCFVVGSVTPSN